MLFFCLIYFLYFNISSTKSSATLSRVIFAHFSDSSFSCSQASPTFGCVLWFLARDPFDHFVSLHFDTQIRATAFSTNPAPGTHTKYPYSESYFACKIVYHLISQRAWP